MRYLFFATTIMLLALSVSAAPPSPEVNATVTNDVLPTEIKGTLDAFGNMRVATIGFHSSPGGSDFDLTLDGSSIRLHGIAATAASENSSACSTSLRLLKFDSGSSVVDDSLLLNVAGIAGSSIKWPNIGPVAASANASLGESLGIRIALSTFSGQLCTGSFTLVYEVLEESASAGTSAFTASEAEQPLDIRLPR